MLESPSGVCGPGKGMGIMGCCMNLTESVLQAPVYCAKPPT